MKKIIFLPVFLILTVAVPFVDAAPAQEVNSILASVNGEAITLMDVLPLTMPRENQLRAIYSGKLLEQEIRTLRKNTVDRLIDSKLLQKEYANQTFRIANSDIEREIDRIAENMGCRSREEFLEKLRKDGMTLETVRLDLEKNMMAQTMIQRQIMIAGKITPGEVYKYFLDHKKEFVKEAKIGLEMLKLEPSRPELSKDVAEISAALKRQDVDFSALIKKYTPGAGTGNLGEIECRLLRPEFAAALKNAVTGAVAGPLQVDGATVWLKVVSYQKAVAIEFKAVEAQITQELEKKRREGILQEYFKYLRKNAVVEYYF